MKPIRDSSSSAPVTQEEIAWNLFELVSGDTEKLDPEKAFALFSDCLRVVQDPSTVPDGQGGYHMELPEDDG